MKIKTKIKKWGLIELESFCKAKETRKQPTEWKKMFANKETNNALSPEYTTSSWNSMKIKKWEEDLSIFFSKKNIQIAKKSY